MGRTRARSDVIRGEYAVVRCPDGITVAGTRYPPGAALPADLPMRVRLTLHALHATDDPLLDEETR